LLEFHLKIARTVMQPFEGVIVPGLWVSNILSIHQVLYYFTCIINLKL
jgi:hypothetical protein